MHVTTHLDGHPYDDLLLRKGQAGFPSFVVMDEDGELLAVVEDRSVDGFEHAVTQATEFASTVRAAKEGKQDARKEVFRKRVEWMALPLDQAKAEFKALELTDAERKALEVPLQMIEIYDARLTADRAQGLAKLLRIHKEGRLLDDPRVTNTYWRYLAVGAEQLRDADAYAVYVEYLRGMVEKQPRMKASLEQAEKKLATLKTKD
ncbi:MAG: hypothetical protein U1F36_00885 [Planctomycetota bacterium]